MNTIEQCEHGHLKRSCEVCDLREKIAAMSRVVEAAKAVAAGMQRRLDYEEKADVSPSTVCTWIDQLDAAITQLKETP